MRNRSTEGLGGTRQAHLGRPTGPTIPTLTSAFGEELRRVVVDAIGQRKPGVVYTPGGSDDVQLKVLAVTTDRDEARRLLGRRAAQFAITVVDIHTGQQDVICTVWTDRDRVLKAVA
ncbi:hypothetical protein [Streptomyces sp. NPDC001205]